MLHVNTITHVEINNPHINIIMLHIDIINLAFRMLGYINLSAKIIKTSLEYERKRERERDKTNLKHVQLYYQFKIFLIRLSEILFLILIK